MSIMTRPSGAFPTALAYITAGTLIGIWTVVSLVYYPPQSNFGHFLVVGFAATGLALLAIGLFVGSIGRSARHAELPPGEVTTAVEQVEQTAAAHPPVIVPGNLAGNVPLGVNPTALPAKPVVTTTAAAPRI